MPGEIFKYLSISSFQIAQIIECKHKNQTFLKTFPGKDSLQEKKESGIWSVSPNLDSGG